VAGLIFSTNEGSVSKNFLSPVFPLKNSFFQSNSRGRRFELLVNSLRY
jgi:hypothetical protein